ncbi:prepilin-type N-terminal cleavage/methylation domain-containing protein [Hyphobacterium sp. HN65]|uniref:Prepilin-type N-terminal cleavage/methylation domain-containing protein n=1 Tax=Hyphobacterium lacteum TaxID=3116575 RepID=A0ABU7LNS3_9PROT|nr:prepilin-type N-terminal cleavage/methylation domain-containing protein [Hyphobacterium sp. HN65]MEE2525565.1 prepilin-type N-terminal cleavage/methylation domain-containing protein [Hyphobacterium sp. HN65]
MKRGFTLAELLVALALTALAIGVMSEGVRRTIDFQQRLETARMDRESQTATLNAIRSRLERLVPASLPAAAEGEQSTILFEGSAARLAFVAADPGYPSRPGLYEYRLEILSPDNTDGAPDSPAILLSRRGLSALDEFGTAEGPPFQSWELELTEPLTFSYGNDARSLQSSWQERQSFPAYLAFLTEDGGLPAILVTLPRAAPSPDPEAAGEAAP